MKHVLSEKTVPRFAKFGVNVLGIDPSLEPVEIAKKSIDMMFDFYNGIGIPMHLREVGIDETRIKEMAHHVATTQPLDGCWAPLSEDDIAAIMLDSL
jgi:butanol dehydrogenase